MYKVAENSQMGINYSCASPRYLVITPVLLIKYIHGYGLLQFCNLYSEMINGWSHHVNFKILFLRCDDEYTLYTVEALLRPLFLAAREGDSWGASRLIENGRAVNSFLLSNGMTPLHIAASHVRVAVAKVLIDNGATKDARNTAGARPIDVRPKCPAGLADSLHSLSFANVGLCLIYVSSW